MAKAQTSKIIIKGADLSAPIEITDPKTLANFASGRVLGQVATGIALHQVQSFIVDCQPMADHSRGLHRYQVSFYAKMPNDPQYDPATEHGYVYLPERTEEWYGLNVSTIFHGVKEKWFPAWSVWKGVARPLTERPKRLRLTPNN